MGSPAKQKSLFNTFYNFFFFILSAELLLGKET